MEDSEERKRNMELKKIVTARVDSGKIGRLKCTVPASAGHKEERMPSFFFFRLRLDESHFESTKES